MSSFVQKLWKPFRSGGTPVGSVDLNRMEQGIADAHAAVGNVTRYDLVNATSIDMPVDSATDRLWLVEFDLSAVFNATVYVRPNGSTLNCAEARQQYNVLTGPAASDGSGVSQSAAGARIINNLGGGGLTVSTGLLRMQARSYGNGERSARVDFAWEQSIGSGNYLAGVGQAAYRMAQYNTQITFLRLISDQANGLNGSVWLTRK